MEIVIKILAALLVLLMCRFFIVDTIKYFKQQRYGYVCVGIILIGFYIYSGCKVWMM